MVWHNHDSQTARANQLACIVRQLNRPHVQTTALVNQPRFAMHPTLRDTPQVIRVDLDAHSTSPALGHQHVRPDRAQCLRQHHTRPAMQQAVRLVRPTIDGHPARYPICADFQHLDTQGICDCGAAS